LADRYSILSEALRQALSYLEANPVDIVTRPLNKRAHNFPDKAETLQRTYGADSSVFPTPICPQRKRISQSS
jgi:hypothetical protein